jgi:hypothetical protein
MRLLIPERERKLKPLCSIFAVQYRVDADDEGEAVTTQTRPKPIAKTPEIGPCKRADKRCSRGCRNRVQLRGATYQPESRFTRRAKTVTNTCLSAFDSLRLIGVPSPENMPSASEVALMSCWWVRLSMGFVNRNTSMWGFARESGVHGQRLSW